MLNYEEGFMLSQKESSDLAAKPNSVGWLSCDLFVYVGGEGEVCSENSTCFAKTGISGWVPRSGYSRFSCPHEVHPPTSSQRVSSFQISLQNCFGFPSKYFFSLQKNFHRSCYKAFSPYTRAANTWAPIALSKLKKFQLSIADIVTALKYWGLLPQKKKRLYRLWLH